MEVSEIKEFIDEQVKECEKELGENPYIVNKIIIDKMYKFLDIKDMLDKLETKTTGRYIPTDDDFVKFECSNCKSEFQFEEVYDYCCNCGCKMENAREILDEAWGKE